MLDKVDKNTQKKKILSEDLIEAEENYKVV
jgi:hypothetical protein